MGTKTLELIDRIDANSDDGTKYEILVHQEMITMETMGETKVLPGLKELTLTNGNHVNFVDNNTFEIVSTGERLTRIR